MKNLAAIIAWFFIPTAADFHNHPGLFWVKAMLSATLWAFVFIGVYAGGYFLFSSDFDDWNEDR